MNNLINKDTIEGRIARYVIILAVAYFSLGVADIISAFFVSLTTIGDRFLGYGITGLFFGYVLWLLFERTARKTCYLLPVFMAVAQLIKSYIAFGDTGRSADFSPFRLLGHMLSSSLGLHILVTISVFAYASILFFERNAEGKSPAN